jgi:FkbM family methyltransferase
MIEFGKSIIKSTFRFFGMEINRYTPSASQTAQIVSSLRKFEIDLIFDVGANQGQFARELRSGGYSGDIVSFEPLSSAHNLLQQISKSDSKWHVHSRCALGGHIGEAEINIAGNSASSSLLPMLNSHLSAAPHTAYVGKEKIPLLTLDSVAKEYLENSKSPFIKIDTQGFEWAVLDGAQDVLRHMRGVLVELSLVPLYEGQHMWEEMISRLEREGFTLWALQSEFIDPHNGRTLQMNGMFYRSHEMSELGKLSA